MTFPGKSLVAKFAFNLAHHGRQRHPLRSLLGDLLGRTGLCHRVTFAHSGCRLRLRRSGLAQHLWADPGLMIEGERFFVRFLREGDTVLDVGANIGVHSLIASRVVGARGRVLAIEPHPATHDALVANLKLNGIANTNALRVAAGPVADLVRMSNRRDDDWNHVTASSGIEVPQMTLDEIARSVGQVALLKIDVEGYELPCLRGAGQILGRTDCVLLEFWAEHARRFGYGWGDLLGLMKAQGFAGFLLVETTPGCVPSPLPRDPPAALANLVFVRDDALLEKRLGEAQPVVEKPDE